MAPRSRDDYDIAPEQASQSDIMLPGRSLDKQHALLLEDDQSDNFHRSNRMPPSRRPSSRILDIFKSRREMLHRRTTSRDRSLWHRATRRITAAPPAEQSKDLDGPTCAAVSRKHNSLMASESQECQRQPPQRRHQTWYYSSNHVLVNRERIEHGLPPMMRSVVLDEKARHVAEWAAKGKDLRACIVEEEDARKFVSGNVLVGKSIREIHGQTLVRETCKRERNNLLNPEYREFGMGTFKDPSSGQLYLCQLFGNGGIEI